MAYTLTDTYFTAETTTGDVFEINRENYELALSEEKLQNEVKENGIKIYIKGGLNIASYETADKEAFVTLKTKENLESHFYQIDVKENGALYSFEEESMADAFDHFQQFIARN